MRLIVIFVILLGSIDLFGQDNFKEGYIVKNSSDTVRGLLKDDTEEKLTIEVIFKSSNGTPESYSPQNILSFGFDHGNLFRLVEYIDPSDNYLRKEHFAKLIFDGINDLYSFIRKDVLFFVGQTDDDTTLLLFNDITTAAGQTIDRGNYQNQLFFIGRTCERMRSKAQNTRYSETALLDYFVLLDKCLSNGTAATVYYVKLETETQLYVFAGGIPLGNKYEIMVQAMAKFTLPSQSRRTSLNTGLVYLRNFNTESYSDYFGSVKEYDQVTEIIEVPLLIQYEFLEKKIRPYVYGGLGLAYKRETPFPGTTTTTGLQGDFGFSLIGGAGIEGYVSKKVFLKIDWRYDLLVHYPVIGIGCRLK